MTQYWHCSTVQAYLTNKDISEFEVSPGHGDIGLNRLTFQASCEGDHPKKWLKILGPPSGPKKCSKPMASKVAHLATGQPSIAILEDEPKTKT